MRILVLGVSGMLGNTVFRMFSATTDHEVFGSARSGSVRKYFDASLADRIVVGTDVDNADSLALLFATVKPQVVINCIGLIKQLADANDPLQAIPINSLLPHRLARLCEIAGARLVHVSTDCVFAGTRGGYRESDLSDAKDLYGMSKYLGEVAYPHTVTLRTSIIGHELNSANGLVGWFLSQQGRINGYTKAIFSGLPTIELSEVIRDVVLPRPELSGLYHVAAKPISKYDLLSLVSQVYGKEIEILPQDDLVIDRSLNAERFTLATEYTAPSWPSLVEKMHEFK